MISTSKTGPKCSSLKTGHDPSETQEHLRTLLTYSLAAYVGARSKEPISVVMNDLFEIEFKAANLIEAFMTEKIETPDLRGSLAGVFSVIPIGKKTIHSRCASAAEQISFPAKLEAKSQMQVEGK